ncbi:hypothetical protein GUITHDRAFT_112531 [Guillardia theta CCMP2712]|uniref:Uncharacterized protein n=1 Tax=Guillardia theta (strain CCMP2712) TaxID=905079 RepID=L1IZT3_GUITC|nr:hypothetical protein GUITHDRAFT_112531 [Guillardia theta CCMP2712]EKX41320.1 hypothetical protein GUITHDRAFT_112531 [Guillardia theta CCMP2712]|eukprot:XP_005828300.1 hypothetical protein GUITHDRAFT_112531 [Guillardia theta CCMP2712]
MMKVTVMTSVKWSIGRLLAPAACLLLLLLIAMSRVQRQEPVLEEQQERVHRVMTRLKHARAHASGADIMRAPRVVSKYATAYARDEMREMKDYDQLRKKEAEQQERYMKEEATYKQLEASKYLAQSRQLVDSVKGGKVQVQKWRE